MPQQSQQCQALLQPPLPPFPCILQSVTPVDVSRRFLHNHELLSMVTSPALHEASSAKHDLCFIH